MYEYFSGGKTRDEFMEMAAAPVHIYDWYGISGKLGNVSVVELKFESNRETERIPDTKSTFDAGICTSYSQLTYFLFCPVHPCYCKGICSYSTTLPKALFRVKSVVNTSV